MELNIRQLYATCHGLHPDDNRYPKERKQCTLARTTAEDHDSTKL